MVKCKIIVSEVFLFLLFSCIYHFCAHKLLVKKYLVSYKWESFVFKYNNCYGKQLVWTDYSLAVCIQLAEHDW